ncbi:hypothetical protein [Kordiimonas marina]|uniref:hypothetical protein n=1 Tax=Kordiimonas marina TaxID=2872312 RepID=UPI001FF3B98F|nr:hypothetical protein [Kordiimonas marina]MCJ9428190.1 hypothetical protein [Kordiimonas marina]
MKLRLEEKRILFKLARAEATALVMGRELAAEFTPPGMTSLRWTVAATAEAEMQLDGLNLTVPRHMIASELIERTTREGLQTTIGDLEVAFQVDIRRDRKPRSATDGEIYDA